MRHKYSIAILILFSVFNNGLSKIFDGDILPEKLFKWLFLRLNDESNQVKATYCDSETCFTVVDLIADYADKALPTVYRTLMISTAPGVFHSAIEMTTKELSFKSLKTEHWISNHSKFISEFNEGIIRIFAENKVVFESEPSRMLFIGLGGGSYPAYFKENYPHVNQTSVDINPLMRNISIDWFDITESDMLRIEIDDGANYVKKLAEEGTHYDGIILDATYNNLNRDVVSPVDVFRTEETVANTAKVLGRNGMMAINVVAGQGRDNRVLEPYHDLLKKYFKYVESRKINIFNTITICSQRYVTFDNLVIQPMPMQL